MGTIFSPTKDYNWTVKDGRKQVWTRGLGYMVSYPVFGLGVGNFQRAECMLSEKAKFHIQGTGLRCTPPHNSYIQAGAEAGIPGLVLWTALVLIGITGPFRLHRRLPKAWRTGDPEERFLYQASLYFALAMIGFATTSFFLSFAWLDTVYIITALNTGLYVSVDRKMRETLGQGWAPVRGARGMRGGLVGQIAQRAAVPVPVRARGRGGLPG
jgi:O-antigen ligase